MAMKIVKLTFENTEGGRYKFFTTADQIHEILDNELFTEVIIDAKTGKQTIHKDEILNALKLHPAPPESLKNNQ